MKMILERPTNQSRSASQKPPDAHGKNPCRPTALEATHTKA